MEVTLTMAPLAFDSGAAKPRASTSGAKKFSSNTRCQPSMAPFRQPSRSLIGVLGEMPALFTSACSGSPFSARLASSTKRARLSGSDRSVGMWWVQLGSRRQSAGTSSREQEITRQPSALKRATVAWPMPRLAPVRMTVLRCGMTRTIARFPAGRQRHREVDAQPGTPNLQSFGYDAGL